MNGKPIKETVDEELLFYSGVNPHDATRDS
jgi:hypothetical protein